MDIVKKLFDTTDLYKLLDISEDKAGDEKALKSAYLRAALKYHPDKGPEDEREERTTKFQVIKQIYDLLQDAEMRKCYQETGDWPDKEEFKIDVDRYGPKLDSQMILDFKKAYLGSEEEREDVKQLYKEGNGDILHVLDNLFFANILDDEERVQGIIDGLIETEEMDKLGKGVNKKTRDAKIRKAKKEAKEAEELRKELKIDEGLEGLKNALAKSASGRSRLIDDLEKKYCGTEKDKASTATASSRGRPRKKVHSIDDEDDEDVPKSKKRKSEPSSSSSKPRGKGRGRPAKTKK